MKELLDKINAILPPKDEVSSRLGVSQRCVNYWVAGQRPLSMGTFEELLRLSGIEDPKGWLHRATSPVDLPRLLAGPAATDTDIVQKLPVAIRAALDAPRGLERSEAADVSDSFDGSPRDLMLLDRPIAASEALALIETLDPVLQKNPEHAGKLALRLVTRIAPRLDHGNAQVLCAAAGVFAATKRFMGLPGDAAAVLRAIIPPAERVGDLGLLALLFRRAAFVLRDRAQLKAALEVTVEAAVLALRGGRFRMLPQILVDLGGMLVLDLQYAPSATVLEQALALLPEQDRTHRCAAFFALGLAYRALDLHRAAADAFGEAASLTSPTEIYNRACILHQEGEAFLAARDPESAATAFRQSMELFAEVNLVTQAYVGVDLIYALAGLGRVDELRQVARRVIFILQPRLHQTFAAKLIIQYAQRLIDTSSSISQGKLTRLRLRARALIHSRPGGQA